MARASLKSRWNVFRDGLGTLTGLRARGFFIPFKHAGSVPDQPPVYAEIEAVMAGAKDTFQEVLTGIAADGDALAVAAAGPLAPHWNGGYFGPMDTAAAFTLARREAPRKIVEVGSGSSTHVLRAACPDTPITCIDPAPRKEISDLGVDWEQAVLTADHVALFQALQPGDIAFFDSSHVLFQGTDCDIIQNRILPAIPAGVLVHIHDIFLPDAYPPEWAHRAYTEQNGLGGWICGGAYDLVYSSYYAGTRMTEAACCALECLPPHGGPGGGSLWLRRTG